MGALRVRGGVSKSRNTVVSKRPCSQMLLRVCILGVHRAGPAAFGISKGLNMLWLHQILRLLRLIRHCKFSFPTGKPFAVSGRKILPTLRNRPPPALLRLIELGRTKLTIQCESKIRQKTPESPPIACILPVKCRCLAAQVGLAQRNLLTFFINLLWPSQFLDNLFR